jgi:integrase
MSTSPSLKRVGECLYRNPASDRYYAVVRVRGKQFKASLKTDNLVVARRKLRDFRNDLGRVDLDAGKFTIEALADRYLATVQHQAPATIRKKKDIAQRVKDQWGALQAKDLKKSQIMGWLASFTFGTGSRNKHLRVVRAMFKLAVEDRILAHSPVDGVKEEKTERPIRHTPSLAEFKAIVDNIRSQPQADTREESADFVEFLGLAGLGLAEASALTWGDVNLERGQIVTFRHKTKQGFAIPIFPQLRPLLEKRLALVMDHNGGKVPSPTAKVFTVANAKKAIEAACKRLNLPGYTSRSFRRTFITSAIERGVDVKVVAQWQGHRDGGKLILDTYSHVRPVHSEQMAKLMTMEKPSNVIPMESVA